MGPDDRITVLVRRATRVPTVSNVSVSPQECTKRRSREDMVRRQPGFELPVSRTVRK